MPAANNDYRLLYLLQKGRCFYCGVAMHPKKTGKTNPPHKAWRAGEIAPGYTRDHFEARCRGNTLAGNVVLACSCCNGIKADTPPTIDQRIAFDNLHARYAKAQRGELEF